MPDLDVGKVMWDQLKETISDVELREKSLVGKDSNNFQVIHRVGKQLELFSLRNPEL